MTEVYLWTNPWVPNMAAQGYFGPVMAEVICERVDLQAGLKLLLETLRVRAAELGANWVVGLEVEMDPYHPEGVWLHAFGTAANLERVG